MNPADEFRLALAAGLATGIIAMVLIGLFEWRRWSGERLQQWREKRQKRSSP